MGISGYVPFFNNASTVLAAVDSLRSQRPALDEVFAIDDGSIDESVALLEAAGVLVLRQPANLGRGAARQLAMNVAQHEFVLCCDATNILPDDFAARALPWFEDNKVAAVVGLITDPNPQGVVSQWRARNLFKADVPRVASAGAPFITFGTMVRSSALTPACAIPKMQNSMTASLQVIMKLLKIHLLKSFVILGTHFQKFLSAIGDGMQVKTSCLV